MRYADNWRSLRCIQVIAGVLGRAGEAGQKKRLEDAKNGHITWLPPPGLGKPKGEEAKAKEAAEAKERKSLTNRRTDLDVEGVRTRGRRGSSSLDVEEDED